MKTQMERADVPGRATASLTVAINAQLDPERAGGVETALNALVAHLPAEVGDERFVLLSTARFHQTLARLAGNDYDVLTWPYPQKAPSAVRRLTPRWQRWREQAGPLGFGVDVAHAGIWNAHHLFAERPDAAKADALLRAHGASVVHFAYPTRFPTTIPFLYEPWDLQHRHLPEFFEASEWQARDTMYREGCQQAALVVTATQWSKRDIVEQYGVRPENIAVIPRGPAGVPTRLGPDTVARLQRELQLPERFAFFPAMSFPHKNHLRLFEALAILRDRHGLTLPLVCTGRPYEPHWTAVRAAVERHGLSSQVRLLGPVSDETLHGLFGTASYLVFPSLFEGLGLPILEALQHRLPVLASNATCLPEVGGDAATYFDGTDIESIVDALLLAERQPELLQQRVQRSAAVLARFDWTKAAATFVACYRAVAGVSLSPTQQALYDEATQA